MDKTISWKLNRRSALGLIGKVIALSAIPTNALAGLFLEPFITVSRSNDSYLSFQDDTPYIPIGLNFCWPPFAWGSNDEKATLASIDHQLSELSRNGGNFIRVWLSAAFFEPELKAGIYDEHIAKRMDAVMEMAKKYNIRVKLCFEHFRKLEGETLSHGVVGKTYDKPIYSKGKGGPLNDMNSYFTTKTGKDLFIKRLEFFSKRYANNPYVFGVELWNEVETIDQVPVAAVKAWSIEMLKKQKQLFPNHLSLQSFGSYDEEGKRSLFKEFYTMPGNELAQVHRYHLPNAKWSVLRGPLDITCANAVQEAVAFKTGRPVLLAEIGVAQADYAGRSKLHDLDTKGIILHDMLFAPFFCGAAGSGHCWYWDVYVQKHNLWYHFSRFAESIKGINPITEGFVPFTIEHPSLRIYGLKGKTKTIVWCRDRNSDMQSELIQNIVPANLEGLTVILPTAMNKKVACYNPWENNWSTVQATANKIVVPRFQRSIVFHINT